VVGCAFQWIYIFQIHCGAFSAKDLVIIVQIVVGKKRVQDVAQRDMVTEAVKNRHVVLTVKATIVPFQGIAHSGKKNKKYSV
jgi:hypothetical protein